ncbi:hypothetical protein JJD41_12880 [Oxynema sp. CENA135]|uniref:hypothetical protein n=1 Tax=Oxynema sp. CENA135 TaxID=984206 RepID=UPI00190D339C|nr:hypothetical protein [Oxynema sp. CENA135]MBK4730751.1 hypothetical protein [Oxynema sp. CENA135]
MRQILILLFFCILLLTGWAIAPASADVSAQVSRLEGEVFNLRSQVNRLESQVYRLENQFSADNRITESRRISPSSPENINREMNNNPDLERQFDRLATLVIEINQRLKEVEAKVSTFESNSNERSRQF